MSLQPRMPFLASHNENKFHPRLTSSTVNDSEACLFPLATFPKSRSRRATMSLAQAKRLWSLSKSRPNLPGRSLASRQGSSASYASTRQTASGAPRKLVATLQTGSLRTEISIAFSATQKRRNFSTQHRPSDANLTLTYDKQSVERLKSGQHSGGFDSRLFSSTNASHSKTETLAASIGLLSAALAGVAFAMVVTVYNEDQVLAETRVETTGDETKFNASNVDSPAADAASLTASELEGIVAEEVRSKFWPVLLQEWRMLIIAISLTFALSIAELFTMSLGGKVIDSALSKDLDRFMSAAWKLCGAVAVQGFLQFISYASLTRATERVRAKLSQMAFASIIYQDKEFFDRHNSAELMSRLSNDISEIRNVTKNMISLGVKSTTSIVGGMVAAFAKSPQLALLVMLAIGSAVGIGSLYARILRRLSKRSKDAAAKAIIAANEATAAVSTVQAFVGEEKEKARHAAFVASSVEHSTAFGTALGFFKGISTAGVSGILVGVLLIGGRMVASGALSVGDLSQFVIVSSSIQSSLGNVAQLVGQVASGRDAVERVFNIIDSKPKINPKSSDIEVPRWFRKRLKKEAKSQPKTNAIIAATTSAGAQAAQFVPGQSAVRLENVSFAYASRPDALVLQDVDIKLEAGKTLSLVGQSGSGKSTISRLILRFYDVTSGRVLVDGVDVKTLDPHWLRNQIGIVEQEPVLFSGSIWENIAYARPDASEEDILAAAKAANCEEFISNFPLKYDTIVGERGAQLSGGQKQRIAIARALLKNPRILILDEATSALDATTETLVQDALNRLMKNRTTLIIAHRLSTIKNSDTIIVLDHGHIVEQGTHDTLSKAGGYYASLVKQQMGQPI